MNKFAASIVAGLCAGALCVSSALAADILRIGGGSSPMENIFKLVKDPFEKKTGIKLDLVENGAVDAYTGLLADELDVASAGPGSLQQWQTMVAKSGAEAQTEDKLVWRIVGSDLITVFTNKNITVSTLTKDQVKDIFTGKIANWKDVGGPDAPIVVVLGNRVPGLMAEFRNKVLDGAAPLQSAQHAGTSDEMKRLVMNTPNAVTIGTNAQVREGGVNVIQYPAPERQISMMWKFKSPKRESIQALYEYLGSVEGRSVIVTGDAAQAQVQGQ